MRGLLIAVLGLSSGCYFTQSASVPMEVVRYSAPSTPPEGMIIFLPGFGDGPEHFREHHFVEHAQTANPRFKAVAANAHFAYYRDFSVVERIHDDLVRPALQANQKLKIWLVGISMGGLGAAVYAMEHPELVEGVVLLAPYLGDREVTSEIQAAGGIREWAPPPDWQKLEPGETRTTYRLWVWFKGLLITGDRSPKLFVGYGDRDRRSVEMVAAVLPPRQKKVLPGGHKWRVWKPLFAELIQQAIRP